METLHSLDGIGIAYLNAIQHYARWTYIVKVSAKADRIRTKLQASKYLLHTTPDSFFKVMDTPRRFDFNGHILQSQTLSKADILKLDELLPSGSSEIPIVIILDSESAEEWLKTAKFWTKEKLLEAHGDTLNYFIL